MGVNVLMAVNTFNCGVDSSGATFCQSIFTYDEERFTLFAAGCLVAQALHAFMFFRGVTVPRAKKWALTYAGTSCLSCVVWAIAAGVNSYMNATHRFIVIGIVIAIHFIGEGMSKRQLVVLRSQLPEHFSIRMRKFAIVRSVVVLVATVVLLSFMLRLCSLKLWPGLSSLIKITMLDPSL